MGVLACDWVETCEGDVSTCRIDCGLRLVVLQKAVNFVAAAGDVSEGIGTGAPHPVGVRSQTVVDTNGLQVD